MLCINQGSNGIALELGLRRSRSRGPTAFRTADRIFKRKQRSCWKVLSVLKLVVMYLTQSSLRVTGVSYLPFKNLLGISQELVGGEEDKKRLVFWCDWLLEMVENCKVSPLGSRGSSVCFHLSFGSSHRWKISLFWPDDQSVINTERCPGSEGVNQNLWMVRFRSKEVFLMYKKLGRVRTSSISYFFFFVNHFLYLLGGTKVEFHCHHLSNLHCAAM